jgi:hypothetical protein
MSRSSHFSINALIHSPLQLPLTLTLTHTHTHTHLRVKPYVPFFPAAYSGSIKDHDGSVRLRCLGLAVGLENGRLANEGLSRSKSIANINTVFYDIMAKALSSVVELCEKACTEPVSVDGHDQPFTCEYIGIDTSLNPSLDEGGSIAVAVEQLQEVKILGKSGSIAAAGAITTALQSLPFKLTGYCGLMLPACEDHRLSDLASAGLAS